jgi:hypothetical protein
MAKRKKLYEIEDKDIESLFLKSEVKAIVYIDRSLEINHLAEAHKLCPDKELKFTIAHNYNKLTKHPEYNLVISNSKIISQNKYNNVLTVPKELVDKYNVDNIPVKVIQGELSYNLYDLPEFKNNV